MTPHKHLTQLLVSDVMTAVTTRRSSCIGVSVDSFVRGRYSSGKGQLVTIANTAQQNLRVANLSQKCGYTTYQSNVECSRNFDTWYNVFRRTRRCVQFENNINQKSPKIGFFKRYLVSVDKQITWRVGMFLVYYATILVPKGLVLSNPAWNLEQ
jgi:hypothetical protein